MHDDPTAGHLASAPGLDESAAEQVLCIDGDGDGKGGVDSSQKRSGQGGDDG
jgi:hypothetical protein